MNVIFGVADLSIRIWEFLDTDGIMVNNLILTPSKTKLVSTIKREYYIKVWIDSGGYQIMVKGLDLKLSNIIDRYRSIEADYYISLDTPIFQPYKKHDKIVERNIRNYVIMQKKLRDHRIVPVVHLYQPELLKKAIDEYIQLGADIIAYGGIVPPMLRKTHLRWASILGFILLRKIAPRVKFHIMGVGSYLMIRIFEKLGAWSLDTSTWRVKASFGHVIIPGLGERYVGNKNIRFGTPHIRPQEKEILIKSLEKTRFPYMDKIDELLSSFKGRALINAWIIKHVNNGINPRSSFFKLYKRALEYLDKPLDELISEYRNVIQNAATKKN